MYQISLREHAKEWERLKNKMTAIDRWDVFGATYPCMPRERIGSVTDGGKWCAPQEKCTILLKKTQE